MYFAITGIVYLLADKGKRHLATIGSVGASVVNYLLWLWGLLYVLPIGIASLLVLLVLWVLRGRGSRV
ncbi:MAG: hypothetical protein MPF33_07055 [Candidatus Aramenus sp.]|nr:hypothetical protein [Candidatus Aramenus sp.]